LQPCCGMSAAPAPHYSEFLVHLETPDDFRDAARLRPPFLFGIFYLSSPWTLGDRRAGLPRRVGTPVAEASPNLPSGFVFLPYTSNEASSGLAGCSLDLWLVQGGPIRSSFRGRPPQSSFLEFV